MNPWSKLATMFAVALSVGVFAQAPEARAQVEMDNAEITAEVEEELIAQPYHYGRCRSVCNDRFDRCLRRALGGYYDWHGGGWRGRYARAYERCENRRDFCILSCRGRGNGGYDW